MDAAINIAEAGHLVIATLHTRSAAETLDRIINFYDLNSQQNVKFMLSSILKLIVAQKLIPVEENKYLMIPEVMVVNKKIAAVIRRPKFVQSEIEDAIQASSDVGSQSILFSLAKAVLEDKITLENAKMELDEMRQETLVKTIQQIRRRLEK